MRQTTTQRIFLIIALMGVLPLVVGWLPMMLIIAPTVAPVLLIGGCVWLLTRRRVYRSVSQLLATLGALIGSAFSFLFGHSTPSKSSRYMSLWRRYRLFGKHKDGFLVDGHKKRVSSKTSFESVVTVGGMGRGKSSIFVMPNLFTITHGSFVISDTSGEIYQKTSGYTLNSKGSIFRY